MEKTPKKNHQTPICKEKIMHVLILADAIDNQNAGVHYYLKNLISALLKIDKKNTYTFIHSKENIFFKNTNSHIIKSLKGLGKESYRRFIKIPKLIKEINPDIVLEPCHIGPFNLPKHIKKAVTIHDLTPVTMPKFHIKRSTIVHKLLLNKVLKNANLILTPSKNTKKDIQNRYSPDTKISVTPLGITQPTLSHNSNDLTQNINPPYILYLGTIEPRKNLEILIEAFLELKKEQNIPHQLVLAGDIGWKNKAILEKAKHKNITTTGYITEPQKHDLYINADLFVYPSIYEGFGLPPLEAMSYNIPVICSTGGSLKEIFQNHALMFDPKDKEKLKTQIMKLIQNKNLRNTLIKKGKKYSEQFTWEQTAKKTIQALEECVYGKHQN